MKFSRVSRDFFFFISNRSLCTDVFPPSEKKSEKRRFFSRFFSEGGRRLYTGYSNRGRKAFGSRQLIYPHRPQSFVSSEKDSDVSGLNSLSSDLNSRGIFFVTQCHAFEAVI